MAIVSTFWAVHDAEFNCSSCLKKYQDKATRDNRKACTVKRVTPILEYRGIKYYTCPSNFYSPGFSMLIDMFSIFQKGVLPFEGGLLDQPSKLIDVFNLIENLSLEHHRDLEEKRIKWQKAQSRLNSPSKKRRR